ncbi:hypothetical protein ACFYOD_36300, partial [Streptomyces sp. NPDC006703]
VLGSYGEQKIVRMGTMEYGARAQDLSHMDKLSWGNYAEPEYTGLSWWWHQGKSLVWDGFIVDGIWGTVTGIDILLGCDGWDAAGQAWKGLAKVATGLAIMMTPGLNGAFLSAPDSVMPKWFRESRTALKETGKALIAYDEWGKNPARAAGGVTFNVLTTVFTGGAGAAAKGGAVARTISVLGKVGRVVDPMTYVFKAGGFGVVKVADVFKGLKGLSVGPLADAAHLTHDPNVPHVTDTYAEWSDGTRLSFKDGIVTRPDGTVSAARVELSADEIAQLKSSLPHAAETSLPGAKSPVLVAAGERAGHGTLDNTTRDSIAGPAAAHEPPGGGGTHNTPSTGGHAADHPPTGSSGPGGTRAGETHTPSQHGSTGRGAGTTPDGRSGGLGDGHGLPEANGEELEGSHHNSGESDVSHGAQHGGGEGGEADLSRPALPPGQTDLTLDQVRKLRDKRTRWSTAEDYFRQLYGGGPERHFPVPTNSHPLYPVETVGGRKVDVPVDLPDGRTLAVEVKTYQEYRTITLDSGEHQTLKVEVPLGKHIKEQIHKDLALRRANPGYDPRWVFTHAGPSAELRNYLTQARIVFVEFGPAPKLK